MIDARPIRARVALAGLLVVSAMLAFPSVASAHSELVSSTPKADSTLDEAPNEVVLSFDEPVQEQGGTIVVSIGQQVVSQANTFSVDGTSASIQLERADSSGTYIVAYRIVSEDGHVVRDSFSFQVEGSPDTQTSAPATQTPDSTPVSNEDTDESTGTIVWVLGLGAIGLVLVAALIAVAVRGRRGRSS